jgi:hypothetical protein
VGVRPPSILAEDRFVARQRSSSQTPRAAPVRSLEFGHRITNEPTQEPTMTITRFAAFAMSTLMTLTMLFAIDRLATFEASDSLLARTATSQARI